MYLNPMTLKQLAQHLGISQSTVSRALNGFPEVNEKTRKKVLAAAKQLNYRPNPIATRLATGKSRSIGHVIPISTNQEMVNPIFSDFLAGAGEAYSKAGYHLNLSVANDENVVSSYKQMAELGVVDGILVQLPRFKDFRIPI
ncbi:MAG: LacI family DNA-binding transcriptional regulator, partial [Paracoccaceae bacterium]|nr:LacI family DNA-binding transcriptional regulator [Paracoccaceae bacterium]